MKEDKYAYFSKIKNQMIVKLGLILICFLLLKILFVSHYFLVMVLKFIIINKSIYRG